MDSNCEHCGQMLPRWDDVAAALEEGLRTWEIPNGLRPMIIQAIDELRDLRRESREVS
jgi:hypothetical protein